MRIAVKIALTLVFGAMASLTVEAKSENRALNMRPVVEVEEDVYNYQPPNNGSGPKAVCQARDSNQSRVVCSN